MKSCSRSRSDKAGGKGQRTLQGYKSKITTDPRRALLAVAGAVGPDLAQRRDGRRIVASLANVLDESLKCLQPRERTGAVVVGLGRKMHEACAVVELVGGVAESGRLGTVQFLVDGTHEFLVLGG